MGEYMIVIVLPFLLMWNVEDVKRTAANDDKFFVFEDTVHQVSVSYQ